MTKQQFLKGYTGSGPASRSKFYERNKEVVMKNVVLLLLAALLLSACRPTRSDIQTAIAETQAVSTKTPEQKTTKTDQAQAVSTPTPKQSPTKAAISCPAKGWDEIGTYLTQYHQDINSLGTAPIPDVNAYVDALMGFVEQIKAVNVEVCSENARQSIIDGMINEINAMQIIASGYARIDAAPFFLEGVAMIEDGIKELAGLGILISYK